MGFCVLRALRATQVELVVKASGASKDHTVLQRLRVVQSDDAQITRLKNISDTTLFGNEDASTKTTESESGTPSARFPLRV